MKEKPIAASDPPLHRHQAEFVSWATKTAWRQDPAAVAGYWAGFKAGWHARDEEIARLQADLDRAFGQP